MSQHDESIRVYRALTKQLVLLTGAITLLGAATGWLVADLSGLWGALMGGALTAFFCGTTAAVMWLTSRRSLQVAMVALVSSWLGKMLVTLVVVLLLSKAHFYNRPMFVAVVAVGVIASMVLDLLTFRRARIPYVDTRGEQTR